MRKGQRLTQDNISAICGDLQARKELESRIAILRKDLAIALNFYTRTYSYKGVAARHDIALSTLLIVRKTLIKSKRLKK